MKKKVTKVKGGYNKKMSEEKQTKGRMPDFKGSIDVAAWENKDNDGKTFLSIVLGTRAKLVPVEKQNN